jgi:Plavaka transposase
MSTHGAMFVPVIIGSDKTTVSVATGHQEFHPVYMSPGNLTNTARRAHGNALLPVAFLPIPKSKYLVISRRSLFNKFGYISSR